LEYFLIIFEKNNADNRVENIPKLIIRAASVEENNFSLNNHTAKKGKKIA
jgi:hypothetical protein